MAGKEDCQIFVGGLSWCTTEGILEAAFRRFGKILDTQVITEKHTGRSRGFGFVTFSDPRAASSAIVCMNNQVLDGRTITVLKACLRHNTRYDTGYGAVNGGRDGHGYDRSFACGRAGHWDRDSYNAGFARRPGRFFSEFTIRGDFFERQGGGFSGDRYDANDGYYHHHWGGGDHVGARMQDNGSGVPDRCGYGSGVPDRRGYDGDHQRGRSCDKGGALRGHGRSASMGPGRRHQSSSRPRGGGGSRGREIVTMTVKVSRAIL